MSSTIRDGLLLAGLVLALVQPAEAEITAEQVRRSIQQGVTFLKSQQHPDRGNWPGHPGQAGGLTSLCTMALLNAGEDPKDPAVQRALNYLRSLDEPGMTYATALQTMAFCLAEPEKDRLLISRNVRWLEKSQVDSGARRGAWGYSPQHSGRADNSNTQFALLALHEAERVGVKVNERTWRLALDYWLRIQKEDGSWGYYENQPSTGSMTSAGIAALVIASGKLTAGAAEVVDGNVRCCGQPQDQDALERALQWLGQKFSVQTNPSALSGRSDVLGRAWLYYYLYGIERVGRLTGRRFIGRHDWYRQGAEMLLQQQDKLSGFWRGVGHAESNPLVATSMALLFLSKGRRPVVIGKLKYGQGQGWDQHQGGVPNLTRWVEQKWRQELTWQTVDLQAATVEDLLQTPVVFLSGQDALELTHAQKENLRNYVRQGGFIFAEACDGQGCDGKPFDRAFRALMQELFPDSPLRLLPPEHPVWFAEGKVNPEHLRPMYGIDACCRTSVVYSPQNLSCYWELSRGTRESPYPAKVQDEIEACLTIGANVLAYATNRELKDKLDQPQLAYQDGDNDQPTRGVLYVPKLSHPGGSDDAPNALPNLLTTVRQQSEMRVSTQRCMVTAADEALYDYPLLFMHGRRSFQFTPTERQALATYLRRGGFLFADAICASPEFGDAFRRELQVMFPDQQLVRIPTEHPLFTAEYRGFDLARVTLRDPQVRGEDDPLQARLVETTPFLEGLEIDGRLAVVFSPLDISCALETYASLECKSYIKDDAARIGINVVLYALQQ